MHGFGSAWGCNSPGRLDNLAAGRLSVAEEKRNQRGDQPLPPDSLPSGQRCLDEFISAAAALSSTPWPWS